MKSGIRIAFAGFTAFAAAVLFSFPSAAQDAPAALEKPAVDKPAAAPADSVAKDAKKQPATGLGQRGDREITLGEQLSFREEQVHEEMSELEERIAIAV